MLLFWYKSVNIVTNVKKTGQYSYSGKLPEDVLKVKKSELRLYCDLLMQQVHGVKCAIEVKDSPNIAVSKKFCKILRFWYAQDLLDYVLLTVLNEKQLFAYFIVDGLFSQCFLCII
jgi:hypothetical protein